MNAVSRRVLSHEVLLTVLRTCLNARMRSIFERREPVTRFGSAKKCFQFLNSSFDKTIRIVGCSREEICRVENLMPVNQPFFD